MGKIGNMWREFRRLNRINFLEGGLARSWEMEDPYRQFGRPVRYIEFSGAHNWKDRIEVKRDRFDQIWDFMYYEISLYINNIFRVERCTHPHDKVVAAWDGDREIGYWRQLQCYDCGGYLASEDDVDRYANERHPEMIEEMPRPFWAEDCE